MTEPITQEQYDLIQLLVERGIARELKPLRERISKLEGSVCYGVKPEFEWTVG